MSNEAAIELSGVGKMYKVFPNKLAHVLNGLGLSRFLPSRNRSYQEFWALREFSLKLYKRQRVGVIGRNGAGKTTLLKLISGNLAPSEGTVGLRGRVQALLETGAGFHPEFTGYENIRAALTLQGLSRSGIESCVNEIEEFTELGEFLQRPYKTYSAGMMARLAFATATCLQPEILIIDEVLGVGDGYFVGKCRDRMTALVDSGAAVLLVSHSLDQVTLLCDETIWLERGRVMMRGPSLEVVKSYQQFLKVLEDRRLRGRNHRSRGGYNHLPQDGYSETLLVEVSLPIGSADCDLKEVLLMRDGVTEDQILIGQVQDSDPTQSGFVLVDGDTWSAPQKSNESFFRRIKGHSTKETSVRIAFNHYYLGDGSDYSIGICYRTASNSRPKVRISRNGRIQTEALLPDSQEAWTRHRFDLGRLVPFEQASNSTRLAKTRWPGEGSLVIESVVLLNERGKEQAAFSVGERLTLELEFRCQRAGEYVVIPVAVIYRTDGIRICTYLGPALTVRLSDQERRRAILNAGPIMLGNGKYLFSVALYRHLSSTFQSEIYDLIDRSYEFNVEGTPPLEDGVFRQTGTWTLT
jgi:lipopolysaccharide transport system ATP-binding protein